MDSRDVQCFGHIGMRCRDILFYVSLCGGDYARFAAQQRILEPVRIALYHIGELANKVTLTHPPAFWQCVCAWSSLRTQDTESMDTRMVWGWIQNDIPMLLAFCEEAKQN